MGLGGRFNAFFSTIISVTVFNIALISTLFWLPTIVGHCTILFRDTLYSLSCMVFDGMLYVLDMMNIEIIFGYLSSFNIKWFGYGLNGIGSYLDMDYDVVWIIMHKMYEMILMQKPLISSYLISRPMLFGYIVLIIGMLGLLCLDLAYYHFKRPLLVQRRINNKNDSEIHSLWVLIEELSRIHLVFWRLIDSVLRCCDFLFQLVVVPYIFGLFVSLATKCIRNEDEEEIMGKLIKSMMIYLMNNEIVRG